MLYPVAPLHGGGIHVNLPTIDLCQSVTYEKIPAPVKQRKCRGRPLEDIIRVILLDSARFYNPNRRRHRREYTSTGTKLMYHTLGGPKQRKHMRSFLWDSDWRHEPQSPAAESSVFNSISHSALPPNPEERVISTHYENSENSRLSPRAEVHMAVSLLDSTHSSFTLPTEHELISFRTPQSSLQYSHGSTLPHFDEGENEPTNFSMESPKTLQKCQANFLRVDNERGYSQESLDSKRWKCSRGQRDRHSSASLSSSSDSSSSFPLTHQVRIQYNPLLMYVEFIAMCVLSWA